LSVCRPSSRTTDWSVSKYTRSPTFCLKSPIEPGVTLVPEGAVACSELLHAAANTNATTAAIVLIFPILPLRDVFRRAPLCCTSFPLFFPVPRQRDPSACYARVGRRNHIPRHCGIKGDHAGSDASVGVFSGRSKRPVISMALMRPPELG